MKKHRDKKVKVDIAARVIFDKESPAEVGKEIGVSEKVILKWVQEFRDGVQAAGKADLEYDSEMKKIRAQEKEIARLREENEILKKFNEFVEKRNEK
ncbi:transposase [Paenalkalicoccus suaedae]|uniref:Transposase n=1 Tax=Paenalkalicoccus suaedae TaxID=2592382 RepID=A0A859FIH0_9BACI|nr:transposase [Paenalkalicoccus suaedae]QKS72524.1 transposase [Paenalkalicoccus suaedae]